MGSNKRLEPNSVKLISVISYNGWLERFSDLELAKAYVSSISKFSDNPDEERDRIQVLVEFESGESERCAFLDSQRTLAWMSRFKRAV